MLQKIWKCYKMRAKQEKSQNGGVHKQLVYGVVLAIETFSSAPQGSNITLKAHEMSIIGPLELKVL